jgi:hypothetical protein
MISTRQILILSLVGLALMLSACEPASVDITPTAAIDPQTPDLPALDLPPLDYGDNTWLILSIEACSIFHHSEDKTVEGKFIQIMLECTNGQLLMPAMSEYSNAPMNAITLTDTDGKTYPTFGVRSDGANVCNRTVILFNNVPDQAGLLLNFLGQAAVELSEPTNTVECTRP